MPNSVMGFRYHLLDYDLTLNLYSFSLQSYLNCWLSLKIYLYQFLAIEDLNPSIQPYFCNSTNKDEDKESHYAFILSIHIFLSSGRLNYKFYESLLQLVTTIFYLQYLIVSKRARNNHHFLP